LRIFGSLAKRLLSIAKRLLSIAKRLLSIAKNLLSREEGSASVEFVLLALPLFIPIFIFLGQFSTVSSNETVLQTLARESLRSYIESSNGEAGEALIRQVIEIGGKNLGLSQEEIRAIDVEMRCSKNPCHQTNGRVRITLTMDPSVNHGRTVQAAAQQYFSPWSN
jgi:Flp pilus assembly protein TadG